MQQSRREIIANYVNRRKIAMVIIARSVFHYRRAGRIYRWNFNKDSLAGQQVRSDGSAFIIDNTNNIRQYW